MNADSVGTAGDSSQQGGAEIPRPPGFAGLIADYLYHAAPRPNREAAIAGTLALLAGVNGRSYTVSSPPTGLNLMIALVMKSAIGKESMQRISWLHRKACERMLRFFPGCGGMVPVVGETFVATSQSASAPALKQQLQIAPCHVNLLSELGLHISQMCTANTQSPLFALKGLLMELSDKSGPEQQIGGINYSDRENNVKPITGPAFSIAGESTPGAFYGAVTADTAENGFLSRWTVIERRSRERPSRNESPVLEPSEDLLGALCWMIWAAVTTQEKRYALPVTPDAKALLDGFDKEADQHIGATDDDAERAIWNRSYVKSYRIAGLLAVADYFGWRWWAHRNGQPEPALWICREHVEWAIELEMRNINAMATRLKGGDLGGGDDAMRAKVVGLLTEYLTEPLSEKWASKIGRLKENHLVPYEWLQMRTQKVSAFSNHKLGATAALYQTLRLLLESGYLMEVKKDKAVESFNYHGKCYRVLNLGDAKMPGPDDWFAQAMKMPQEPK